MEIPRPLALRLIYLGAVTAGLLVLFAVSGSLQRRHALDTLFLETGRASHFPPALLASVAWKESRFDPAALGEAGEIGLMQITEGAAADWARVNQQPALERTGLWDPRTNITIGGWYLQRAWFHWRAKKVPDPLAVALAEYNAGRKNAAAWVKKSQDESIPFLDAVGFPGTRQYIIDITARYRGHAAD